MPDVIVKSSPNVQMLDKLSKLQDTSVLKEFIESLRQIDVKYRADMEGWRKDNAWREAGDSIPKPQTTIYQEEGGTYKNINLPPKTDMSPDEISALQSAIASRNPQAMNTIQKQIAERRKSGAQQGQQVRAMKNNPAYMDASVKVRNIFSQFEGQYDPNIDPLENLNKLIQSRPDQAQEINSMAAEALKKTGGKTEPKIDKDFMSSINNLDDLYKARASIEKGVDPMTAMVLPQGQLDIAKKTINSQIASRESIISGTWPDEWKRYQAPTSGPAKDTMRQFEQSAAGGQKMLDKNTALQYLQKARRQAQELAARDGFKW